MNKYAYNKTFWKKITRFLSSKALWSTRSTIEKEAIISDHEKVAEILSNFFEEAVDKLDISECSSISNSVGYSYLVKNLITKYESHSSTVPITEKLKLTARFQFREVNLRDIEK